MSDWNDDQLEQNTFCVISEKQVDNTFFVKMRCKFGSFGFFCFGQDELPI